MRGRTEQQRQLVHETLKAGRALIADPRDWCGFGAMGKRDGQHTRCAVLAVAAVGDTATREACDALCVAVGVSPVASDGGCAAVAFGRWNDTHTHAEVLVAFDRAIAATAPVPSVGDEVLAITAAVGDEVLAITAAVDDAASTLADVIAPNAPGFTREDVYQYARGELWCAAQDVATDCELVGRFEAEREPLPTDMGELLAALDLNAADVNGE